ncbi:hypothetical protein LCGC14_1862030 [marine sediment metagenome]|uniref:Uncharacterized protein n=1 Tax=marine sediment metagenome TaxID=412755 RepID=A0A0F9J673_9ZZZZ
MTFGGDFFKVLNIVVALLRMFGRVFGDEATKNEVKESEERSADDNPNNLM